MPCRCDYMEPSTREKESFVVRKFLYETGLIEEKYYGLVDVRDLDRETQQLCKWCETNNIKDYSLELQIWWRDHQIADAKRKEAEQKEREELKVYNELTKNLSEHELEILKKYLKR